MRDHLLDVCIGRVPSEGVVGDQTWAVSLHAASATAESAVGLQFVIGRT